MDLLKRNRIQSIIDSIIGRGSRRREAAQDMSIKAMRCTDSDWLTESELQRMTRLQADIVTYEPTTEEWKIIVARKRSARLEAMNVQGGPKNR